jgi:hypothetical protein
MTPPNGEAIAATTLSAVELTAAFQTHRRDTERQLPLPYHTTVEQYGPGYLQTILGRQNIVMRA